MVAKRPACHYRPRSSPHTTIWYEMQHRGFCHVTYGGGEHSRTEPPRLQRTIFTSAAASLSSPESINWNTLPPPPSYRSNLPLAVPERAAEEKSLICVSDMEAFIYITLSQCLPQEEMLPQTWNSSFFASIFSWISPLKCQNNTYLAWELSIFPPSPIKSQFSYDQKC